MGFAPSASGNHTNRDHTGIVAELRKWTAEQKKISSSWFTNCRPWPSHVQIFGGSWTTGSSVVTWVTRSRMICAEPRIVTISRPRSSWIWHEIWYFLNHRSQRCHVLKWSLELIKSFHFIRVTLIQLLSSGWQTPSGSTVLSRRPRCNGIRCWDHLGRYWRWCCIHV